MVLFVWWFLLILHLVKCEKDDIGTFWHYTDFHVDLDQPVPDNNGLWGTYDNDTNMIVAFTGIEIGNDFGYAENAPDFVLWGGDSMRHQGNITERGLRDALETLSGHFKQAFPPNMVNLVPILGNHDVVPINLMSSDEQDERRLNWCRLLASDAKLWKQWITQPLVNRGEDPLDLYSFWYYCYHAHTVRPGLVVFGLNSLAWSVENNASKGVDPLNQFAWLRRGLEFVRTNKSKAIIATHHPFGLRDFEKTRNGFLRDEYNEKLVQILREFSDVIITTLASHEHIDTFRVILNETFYPIGTMFLGPSVNPLHIENIGSTNPRFRKYFYDRKRGVVTDYIQYYLKLSERGPAWIEEYQARKRYNLENLSPLEMARLLDEFTEHDNYNGRWDSFWNHQLGGRPHLKTDFIQDGQCPVARSVCRCKMICTMRHLDRNKSEECYDFCSKSEHPALKTIDQILNPHGNSHDDVGETVGIVIGVLLVIALAGVIAFAVYRKKRGH